MERRTGSATAKRETMAKAIKSRLHSTRRTRHPQAKPIHARPHHATQPAGQHGPAPSVREVADHLTPEQPLRLAPSTTNETAIPSRPAFTHSALSLPLNTKAAISMASAQHSDQPMRESFRLFMRWSIRPPRSPQWPIFVASPIAARSSSPRGLPPTNHRHVSASLHPKKNRSECTRCLPGPRVA